MQLLYHEAAAEWYNWPLGREQAKPAHRSAIKTSIIAALQLLYHVFRLVVKQGHLFHLPCPGQVPDLRGPLL